MLTQPFLKTLRESSAFSCLVFMVLITASPIFLEIGVGEEKTKPLSLEEARSKGREKSRLMKIAQGMVDRTTQTGEPDLATFERSILPLLQSKCLACHGPDVEEGNLRVDSLDPDLLSGKSLSHWREIYKVIGNEEMPPADEADYQMSDEERGLAVDWLSQELTKASFAERNSTPHTSFRRLTRQEYEYVMKDLLKPPYPLGDRLPTESASEDGFLKSSEMLQMSAMQFETYRELGLEGLGKVTAIGERPVPVVYNIFMSDHWDRISKADPSKLFSASHSDYKKQGQRPHLLDRSSSMGVLFSNGSVKPELPFTLEPLPEVSPVVMSLTGSFESKWNLDRFLPDEGVMRVSVRAGRTSNDPEEHIALRLIFSAHTSNNANFTEVISQHDIAVNAPVDEPEYVHFDIPLSQIQRNPFRKLETTFPRRDEFLHLKCISHGKRAEIPVAIHIDHIRITAPFYAEWPPQTHTDIFIENSDLEDQDQYVREVLKRFVSRAWRRPAKPDELDRLMILYQKYLPQTNGFEEAVLEVLGTILASPEFLYLAQFPPEGQSPNSSQLDDFALASRLSFFLWSSIPDEELLRIARGGQLNDAGVRRAQVRRMLEDPKAERFAESFVSQWLGLSGLDSITHVKDAELVEAMRREPIEAFRDLLAGNDSVLNFLHDKSVWVNERLAKHYGIPNVYGPHFQKVDAPSAAQRGGILTSAAVMAMNSDGEHSNPLQRGVWMLEHILNDPPPPPPPDVPEVDLTDPRILEMTLKERIADHRNHAACRSCHARIDPWGIAFENYNAQGAFRSKIGNEPVDATAMLFSRQKLDGIAGLKRYLLLDRQDQFVHALVYKMTTYALGRPLQFGDQAEIDKIATKLRKTGDGLQELVFLITESSLFNSRAQVQIHEQP